MKKKYIIQEENNCVLLRNMENGEGFFVTDELKGLLFGEEDSNQFLKSIECKNEVDEYNEFFFELEKMEILKSGKLNGELCKLIRRPDFVSKRSFVNPLLAFIQITENCNMRCKHCFNSCADNRKNQLTTEDVKKIAIQLKDMHVINASVTGGEPLLHNDFQEIFLALAEQGIKMNITTNGTAPRTKEMVKFFKDNIENVRYITFSLAVDLEDYSLIREAKYYDTVIENLLYYRENGIESTFTVTMSKDNFHKVENAFIFAKNNGIKVFAMNLLKKSGNAQMNLKAFDYSTSELIEFYKHVNELEKKYEISVFNDFNTVNRDNSEAYEISDMNNDAIVCGASKSNIVIGADKRIYPCSMVEEKLENMGYKSPTIDEISLFDAFHLSPQFHFFKNKSPRIICEICNPYLPMLTEIFNIASEEKIGCIECNKCVLEIR